MNDLIVILPCTPYENAIKGLFSRPNALGVKSFNYKIVINQLRDSGCRKKSASILRPFINKYVYALILFDLHGCGADDKSREQIEESVENELYKNGWSDRSAVIVVDPEIEAWVWSDSPQVDKILNWHGRQVDVRSWIKANTEYWIGEAIKPQRPKEAMRRALREANKAVSADIFRELAERVSLNRCVDPSFGKLKQTLISWFGKY